ncbi:hypothetical protein D3C71_78910 [compost metagenome]
MPTLLILSTNDLFEEFFRAVSNMPFYSWSKDQVAEILLSTLAYENSAEVELVNTATDFVMDHMGTPFENQATELSNLLMRIGESIYNELQMFAAYSDGYLFYQYHGWCDLDIVLGRFTPQEVAINF